MLITNKILYIKFNKIDGLMNIPSKTFLFWNSYKTRVKFILSLTGFESRISSNKKEEGWHVLHV